MLKRDLPSDSFRGSNKWKSLGARNLIIIRRSCCIPTSSVDILNNNDVINEVCEVQWCAVGLHHNFSTLNGFLSFTLNFKDEKSGSPGIY